MEARDSAHSLGLQMQAFYEHYRAGGGAFPPYQPSPLQLQQPSPHQHHQHFFPPPHHFHHQQQQQQQQLQEQHHQQQQLQEQHHQQQHQQLNASRNSLNSPGIHSPAPLRQMNPTSGLNLNPNPNLNPSPGSNLNPNSSSGVSACYPPETPPHMMPPHQLQAASSSPPSGVGMSMSPGSAMVIRSAPTVKRKRGRPRKYATDGNGAALVIPLNSVPPAEKKGGRVPIEKTQIPTSGTAGQGFTPHVLTVGAGEDITAKIMTFSQHGPWAVCILSANGAISNASLWHSGISSSSVTYEGRFEILSLSGLFLLTGDGAARSRSGGFSVSLAGQDGRVIGGRVAGLLIAATPIQVVIGTFFQESRKSQAKAVNVEGQGPACAPTGNGAQQASMAMLDRTQLETSGPVRGHVTEGAVKEEERASHVTPLQAADWGFDVEARNHSAQI